MRRTSLLLATWLIPLLHAPMAFAQSAEGIAHSSDMSRMKRVTPQAVEQPNAIPPNATPVIRVYKDFNAWFGENRDSATLQSLGKVQGADWFVHPTSDCAQGIPSGTNVVVFTSNGVGDVNATNNQNNPACQAALQAFVNAGNTLVVDMGDNHTTGGYMAPGAQGTPDHVLPNLDFSSPPPYVCGQATFTAAARGPDGMLGTADDHPIVKGPDGAPGTGDDLDDDKIDMANSCSVAHGHFAAGITLPAAAKLLMTANFQDVQQPILAEYCIGSGRVILDTITKEYVGHTPQGYGPTAFMTNLFSYAMSPASSCGFKFTGFKSPVDNAPTLNIVKAGSAIPLKFSLAGNQGLNVLASGSPTSAPVSCSSGALPDTVEETVTSGTSGLTYDAAADQYVYVWKTDKAWSSTCRQLTMRLSDGSVHTALFQFTR